MSNIEDSRSQQRYLLTDVPRQDYYRQLQEPSTSRSSTIHDERTTPKMEQLAAALRELAKFQQEQQCDWRRNKQQQEED